MPAPSLALDEASASWWSRAGERPPGGPLAGRTSCDVAVVGLGVGGLSAALELAQRGADVVAIDAGGVAAGASGRNGGFLLAGLARFHHDAVATIGRARAAALYRRTLEELETMAAAAPSVALRRTGSVRIACGPEEEQDCHRQLAAMHADGLPAEPYDGPEGRGLLVPTDGTFDPAARAAALAAAAVRAGARLHGVTRVLDAVAVQGGVSVRTQRGDVACRRAVVAVDGGLEVLLPELAGRVRTARAQMLATAPDDGVTVPRPVYARYGMEYWQQRPDGAILLGGYRDAGGEAEWTSEAVPSAAVQALLEAHLRDVIGSVAPTTHRWAGAIAFTTDGMPVVEEVRPGVIAVGGYSGTGNVMGALCGRAAAAMALGDPPDALLTG